MKTILFKLLFITALLPTVAFSANGDSPDSLKGRHTREKKITKQYNVAENDILKINNSYGNIDLKTWDQNKVSIEVIIRTNGNDEQKVKEKLDEINVEFNQSSTGVSAKTIFRKDNSSWISNLFDSGNNVNMEINYIVRAPATNNIDFNNDYGHIFIDKLSGNARISCDYGRLDIGELNGNNNQINFDYSRNSRFGFINRGVINADYSEFTVEDAKSLDVNADYTTSKIKKVESLKFSCDYGSLTVDKVKVINGSGDYLSTKIGELFQSANLNFDYGSASIDKIMKGAGDIKIKGDYTGLKIGYDPAQAFNFAVNTSYAGVKGLDEFQVNKQNQSSSSKSYSGHHLNNSGKGNIQITSSYGSVTFQKQ